MKYIRITISILLMLSLMACIYMRPTSNSELSENEVLVYSFYSWYIESIKMSAEDFKPIFVESSDGMTILDFSRYVKNLKKYHFSEELVQAEIGSYSQCAESLKNVKYADFRVNRFSDLDEYENMGCDFGNGLRWLGGWE